MDGQNNWDPNAPQGQTDQPGTPTGQVNPTPAGDTGEAPGGAPAWTPPTSPTPEPTIPEPNPTPEQPEETPGGGTGEDKSGQTPPGTPGM